MQTAALIVAAGMSSRMGDFKPMLSIGSISIAQRVVATFQQAGIRKIVTVTASSGATPRGAGARMLVGTAGRICVTIGGEDYVCVMTRGHAGDTIVQAQVLKCRPCYCGVIGSRHKAAGVRRVLKEEYGLTEEELNGVTTPIGISIQAETPAEIAISIAAQMIAHRAERNNL